MQLQTVFQFDMKLFISIFSMLLTVSFVGTSFAQEFIPFPSTDPTLPEVSLQLVLRNSEGQLIAYIEPTLAYIPSVAGTHQYLDQFPDKKIITKDGKNLEVIEFQFQQTFTTSEQFATYSIGSDRAVYLFRHDAFLSHPGDVITAYWHIVRTMDR
jgi:hypothetical protein